MKNKFLDPVGREASSTNFAAKQGFERPLPFDPPWPLKEGKYASVLLYDRHKTGFCGDEISNRKIRGEIRIHREGDWIILFVFARGRGRERCARLSVSDIMTKNPPLAYVNLVRWAYEFVRQKFTYQELFL